MKLRSTILALAALLLVAPAARAQDLIATAEPPSAYALTQFTRALAASDYRGAPILLLKSRYVPNAMATTRQVPGWTPWGWQTTHQPVVLYNPQFMTQMEFTAGDELAALSILAHEIGHHHHGHTLPAWGWPTHPWSRELEADRFAGAALARLGATPHDLAGVHRQAFSRWGSSSHPDSYRRIQAIAQGWRDGGGVGSVEDDLWRIYLQLEVELTRWH